MSGEEARTTADRLADLEAQADRIEAKLDEAIRKLDAREGLS